MRTDDLTVVETRGNLVERARQLGEAVRENHRTTAGLFEPHRPLLTTNQGRTVLENVTRRYLSDCADMLPYLDAFADGLGTTREELLELNVLVSLAKSKRDECSGVILAREGRIVVGQNWDTGESAVPMALLEIGRDPDGVDTARFASCLTLDFWSGVNPFGLAMGGCSGGGDPIGSGQGIPVTLWRGPLFYRSRSVAEVKDRVESVPMPGKGANCVFVDREEHMLWVQQGGSRYGTVAPERPFCAATGYRPAINEPSTPQEQAEFHRWQRFMTLCDKATTAMGDLVEDMKTILADHHTVDDRPNSAPCRHDGPRNSTQFSIITDLTSREIHYCGRPCENPWRRIDLA